MANLYVTEFTGLGMQAGNSVPIMSAPSIVQTQKVSYTTATTVTLASGTRYCRLLADADFHLETDGTAATVNEPLYKANIEYFVGVETVSTFSVYDGAS